ncbi:MAG: LPS-assembly protein LptD, partial [Calothrix sp. SM1_5_4]|nr:LPS-assembly protein LptD [Calothrix sp. SM1_5_4]
LKREEGFNRWFTRYGHYFDLPDGYVSRADINLVSDLRYPRDFPDELPGHGDPALESRASISRSTDNHYWSAEGSMYTNLLKEYPMANNEDSVNRLPEIKYSLKERQLLEDGPFFSLNVDYVNFARNNFNYDDLGGDPRRPLAPEVPGSAPKARSSTTAISIQAQAARSRIFTGRGSVSTCAQRSLFRFKSPNASISSPRSPIGRRNTVSLLPTKRNSTIRPRAAIYRLICG